MTKGQAKAAAGSVKGELGVFGGPGRCWSLATKEFSGSGSMVGMGGDDRLHALYANTPATRTPAGIGIGSTKAQLLAAYPSAKLAQGSYWVSRDKSSSFGFHLAKTGKVDRLFVVVNKYRDFACGD